MSDKNSTHGEKVKHLEPFHTAYSAIVAMYDNRESIGGLATGFVDIDRRLSGLHNGDLILITGAPSVGKTVFASNIACHAVITQSRSVLYFTLEMRSDRLALRMLVATGRMKCSDIYSGNLSDEDWSRQTMAVKLLCSNSNVIIVDSITAIAEMVSYAKSINESKQLGLIVVDYLQLVNELKNEIGDMSIIANLMVQFKSMARDLDVPVIVLANHVYSNSDIKNDWSADNNSIPHIDIHLDIASNVEASKSSEKLSVTTIEIVRARNAEVGKFSMLFSRDFIRFDNLIEGNNFIRGYDHV